MSNAIILHGMPSREEYYDPKMPSMSNAHWLPWLQGQLLKKDIAAETPEIAMSFSPEYAKWCKEFERYDIGPATILVGHSLGGGFLIRWLSENDVRAGKVVLVAPWLDPDRSEKYKTGGFFDFEIDKQLAGKTDGLTVFISDDDSEDQQTSIRIIEDNIKGVKIRRFKGYGHFTIGSMKTHEFPELLEECLAENT